MSVMKKVAQFRATARVFCLSLSLSLQRFGGQVRFREDKPPALECCVCHEAFGLYGDYWRHFGGGR